MRVVAATPLLREAAAVLGPVREEVVVVGALAVQIALDDSGLPLTPTGDVDAGTATEDAPAVIAQLESAGLERSAEPQERDFTWVRGELKVQLMRPYHRFPPEGTERLPVNNLVGELRTHRWPIAFAEQPTRGVLWAATPAALVALKEIAFGRTRPSGEPVDRDFSDVAALLDHQGELIAAEVEADGQLRKRVRRAAARISEEPDAIAAAAREMVGSRQAGSVRSAEATAVRAGRRMLTLLDEGPLDG